MSADNGIYIGKFPTADGKVEWRVAHAQAIENCDDGYELVGETDAWRVLIFGRSESYASEEEALQRAKTLADEVDYTEYGICSVDFNRPLLSISVEEAERQLNGVWNAEGAMKSGERSRFVGYDMDRARVEEMTKVTFRADAEMLVMIDEIAETLEDPARNSQGGVGRRSAAIRLAIVEAAERRRGAP